MRWNIFGLQGSLLYVFLPQPIRLKSLIIGELFQEAALNRAINERVKILNPFFPQIFQVQTPCQFYQTVESFEFGKETIEKKHGIESACASGYG